ncbi:hypothetical protein SCLCIDRAFT_32636 [Scleroderma citrinum Foug A]|uniref:Uncharacterized protein n=1 Tax=Scleroderma citrinum Foug A TaxID=1036808 RepID=A0A0C3CV68_9AGAM|nr:hypothetical protein SCLCIDRAFT_32636 [Scleroderma citrinum Foug A]
MLGDERLLETVVSAQVLYAALDVAGLEAGISGERNLKWIKLLELLYEAGTVGLDSSAATSGNGNGKGEEDAHVGGQTPEGKPSCLKVQLEIDWILQEL